MELLAQLGAEFQQASAEAASMEQRAQEDFETATKLCAAGGFSISDSRQLGIVRDFLRRRARRASSALFQTLQKHSQRYRNAVKQLQRRLQRTRKITEPP